MTNCPNGPPPVYSRSYTAPNYYPQPVPDERTPLNPGATANPRARDRRNKFNRDHDLTHSGKTMWFSFLGVTIVLMVVGLAIETTYMLMMSADLRERESLGEVRRKWEQERRAHEREKDHLEREWEREREEYQREHERWERERQDHKRREEEERKHEEDKREEERRHRAEDRKRLGLYWGELEVKQCVSYATREYAARLWNIPSGYDWRQACEEMPIDIHNRTIESPNKCEDQGVWGLKGHWLVDFDEPACVPYWGDFYDHGCIGEGRNLHRWEARLWNLQTNDDWTIMCSTTPVEIHGVHHAKPTYCEYRGVLHGMVGMWDLEDPNCY